MTFEGQAAFKASNAGAWRLGPGGFLGLDYPAVLDRLPPRVSHEAVKTLLPDIEAGYRDGFAEAREEEGEAS
ncbi:hypothetical protein FKB34_01795 [Glycocaulis profundi]|nr:hypothetical protein FKB34_01795 [Glycocaulis profundi]